MAQHDRRALLRHGEIRHRLGEERVGALLHTGHADQSRFSEQRGRRHPEQGSGRIVVGAQVGDLEARVLGAQIVADAADGPLGAHLFGPRHEHDRGGLRVRATRPAESTRAPCSPEHVARSSPSPSLPSGYDARLSRSRHTLIDGVFAPQRDHPVMVGACDAGAEVVQGREDLIAWMAVGVVGPHRHESHRGGRRLRTARRPGRRCRDERPSRGRRAHPGPRMPRARPAARAERSPRNSACGQPAAADVDHDARVVARGERAALRRAATARATSRRRGRR